MSDETLVLLDGLMFPEAPRWRDGWLWFTDQHARRVARVDLQGRVETLIEMDDLPGGLGWLPDGRLLVVAMTQRRVYRLEGRRLLLHADLSGLASWHCNDMLVNARGQAYVGNFGFDLHGGAPLAPAELVRVEPDGSSRVVARDLIFPNGAVISADGRSLILAETFAARLTAFELDVKGELGERRLWADLGDAHPDGICLDAAGAIWVAAPNLGELLRVEEGGRVSWRIRSRGAPYACALGGDRGCSLFICSSESDDPAEACRRRSGRIETVQVAVAGW